MSAVVTSVEGPAGAGAVGSGLLVSEDCRAGFEAMALRSLDDLFALSGQERLEKASLPSWRERIRFDVPGLGLFYLKRYSSPPFGVQVRRILAGRGRRSTGRIEWEQIRRLEAAGIGSITCVAFGEEMASVWERRSAVVTAALSGESLERYVQSKPERVDRDRLLAFGRYVAAFHRAGFVHRDLYLSHVFYDKNDDWLLGGGWIDTADG